ncbi:MAG: glycerol-3-phosphate dehydrogenase/oxidase [Sphingobacteriales bacterium]|nr:glycerol-3-phosphate dehydrogenase/oxidase [Sphingobacteriales bacterium]MBP8193376.1 glycerol-3-phosphate dehydrogenase/oxidase [Chitinophagales bacterium]
MSRQHNIQRAVTELFDVVVIGGGITGAGIALTAARKGWKTLIIDKHDFAFGTSSRSAKMIHGGLRYLQNLQIKLVKEALHEREHLLKEYPHLVKPQPFFMPIYKSRLSKIKLGIGLSGYDYLTGESSMPKHTEIDLEEVKQRFPQLKTDAMVGGFVYYDAKTNDARLTNEVIQEACDLGAIALNYFELTTLQKGNNKIKSITCEDKIAEKSFTIKSKVFIAATGIWTDEILRKFDSNDTKKYMMPSKGVHLIVSANHFPKDCVMLLPTANGDGRMIWCMPWDDNLNVIGTTDTDYNEGNDEIFILENEVKYILDSVNAQLKEKKLTEDDILSVYAGIRPLLNDNDENKKSNQRSRDYQIWWNNDNMLTISGGKLTSFLSMAENCIKTIEEKHAIQSTDNDEIIINTLIDNFKHRYGVKNATLIANIAQEELELTQQFTGYEYCPAEIIFFIRYQNGQKLDDILTRRTLISYQMKDFDEDLVKTVSEIMAKELNWSAEQITDEINLYRHSWKLMHSWK